MPTASELRQLLQMQYPDDYATWEKDLLETPYPHYFAVFNVDPDSVRFDEELEQAYRLRIRDAHPDINAGRSAAEHASFINRAHDTLKNKHLRRGYLLFFHFLIAMQAEMEAEQRQNEEEQPGFHARTGSASTAPAPRLEVAPHRLDVPEPLPVRQRMPITLRVRNTGGPSDGPPLRIRTPRHPSHPRANASHWLYPDGVLPTAIGPTWTDVQLLIDTGRLKPGERYSEEVYVDFSGQEERCRVSFTTTATPRAPQAAAAQSLRRSSGRLVALVSGALALVLVIGAVLVIASSNGGGSKHGAGPGAAAATSATAAAPQGASVAAQVPPPPQAAPASPSSTPPPAPPPSPSPTPPPTPAPSPTPVPSQDTPPGTVLRYGGGWHQGGLALSLTQADLSADRDNPGLNFSFQLQNQRTALVAFHFPFQSFTVTDNLGKTLTVTLTGCDGPQDWDFTLNPKETRKLPLNCDMHAKENITSPAVTALYITADGISSIANAKWVVPIDH